MIQNCQLICPNNTHDPIPLPDGKPVVVGRSKETRVIDPRCSRHQVEITAHWTTQEVIVTQLGTNSSSIDGVELQQNRKCKLQKGGLIYLLMGQYPQRVEFIYKDEKATESMCSNVTETKISTGSKRPASTEESPSHKIKKQKMSNNIEQNLLHSNDKSEIGKDDKSVEDDEEDIQKLEAKLKILKQNAAVKKFKFPDSEETNCKDTIKANSSKQSTNKTSSSKLNTNQSSSSKQNSSHASSSNPNQNPVSSSNLNKSSEEQRYGPPASETTWQQHEKLYVCTRKGVQARNKIAGFDIDGTIITTQSGKTFPTHVGDWRILFPEIPGRLKKLHSDGYKIVFFTNQLGVSKGKTTIDELKKKFSSILDKIGVPAQILISTGGGIYRKPAIGMWNFLIKKGNEGVKISLEDSLYVGDAAGRPEKWAAKKKKDFSCSDRLFAMNIGLKFATPEEFFLFQKRVPFNLPDFDPRTIDSTTSLLSPSSAPITSKNQEVILLVGSPACGKSFFAKTYLVPKGYVHVNRGCQQLTGLLNNRQKDGDWLQKPQLVKRHFFNHDKEQIHGKNADFYVFFKDTLGTWKKCVAACSKALREGQSVVIDNTNPDIESRQRYISCAKSAKVPCRCFFFTATMTQAKHNERYREMIDKSHQPINDMIMNTFKSKLKEPELSEGFTEIVRVNFVPKFEDSKHEKLYRQFLLEK